MSDLPLPPARARPERQSGRRRSLDRDAVVDAALRVLDAEGLDAVTIRRVAQRARHEPGTALYTLRAPTRRSCVDLLLDRVIAEFDVSSIPARPALAGAGARDRARDAGACSRRTATSRRRRSAGYPHGEHALTTMDAACSAGYARPTCPDGVDRARVDLLALYVGSDLLRGDCDPEHDRRDGESFVDELRSSPSSSRPTASRTSSRLPARCAVDRRTASSSGST